MKSTSKMPIVAIFAIMLIALAALYVGYVFFFGHANPPLPQNTVTIGSAVGSSTADSGGVQFNVEIASTTTEQTLGLSYRDSLAPGTGMFFEFGAPGVQNFWMKDMKFAIDIIWIAGDRVTGFAQNAQPQPGVALWSLKIFTSPDGVDKVLEVNAGTVAREGIKVGDAVRMNPSSP